MLGYEKHADPAYLGRMGGVRTDASLTILSATDEDAAQLVIASARNRH